MAKIHPLSVVDPQAQLHESVEVGPFCVIGPCVKMGPGNVLKSHVTIHGDTTIGADNEFYPGAAVGCDPQDKKYAGEPTKLVMGDRNVVREHCTISIGTVQDEGITRIGSDNLFMANVHIAHDVVLGNHTILANNVALAGHTEVGDYAIVGGQTGCHQFTRIGAHAMVGGASGVVQDVPPFLICNGNPAKPHGLNLVGLRRHGFSNDVIKVLNQAYKIFYREGLLTKDALAKLAELAVEHPEAAPQLEAFMQFVKTSERGVIR